MVRRPGSVLFQNLGALDADRAQPLVVQVEARIRSAILSGNLTPGTRLPSSRVLAGDLKVSRHTIEWAFTRLQAAGFLVRKRGSGTYVAQEVPARERPPRVPVPRPRPPLPSRISRRGSMLSSFPGMRGALAGHAFIPSLPAHELVPRQLWTRLINRALRRPGLSGWAYGPTAGVPELRAAIAAHVSATRGVVCSPEQVIVVSSGHQTIDLTVRVLIEPGEAVWVEDPTYQPAARLFRGAGAEVIPVPVDRQGFDLERARARHAVARLAYITPSQQYPSGGLMPPLRRAMLVAWAQQENGWILEDDYDGDFRYQGRPLAALQALDPPGRVIYAGSFNKILFPGLRIAFLVAPTGLVDAFVGAKFSLDAFTPGHTQMALAEFIREGHLATHVRHLLVEYDRRRQALLEALRTVEDDLEVGDSEGGMHLTVYLRRTTDEFTIAERCARSRVILYPLSRYYLGPPRFGFVLGFAGASPGRIQAAMRVVARALKEP